MVVNLLNVTVSVRGVYYVVASDALDCLQNGKKRCWQPFYDRSNERYGSFSTILTAMDTYTRSSNERSVKHVMRSKLIVLDAEGQPRFISIYCMIYG